MASVLTLVLTNFWPFVGAVVLVSAVGSAVAQVIRAIRGVHCCECDGD